MPRTPRPGPSKLEQFRSGTSSALPDLLLIRLLFRRLLLPLHGPGWDDAIHPRVRHQLSKMLVRISDQNVNHVPRIRLRTQLRQQLGEVRVGHLVCRLLLELPRLVQFPDDLGLIGRGFFKRLPVESGGWRSSHEPQNPVALARDVEKHFRERPRVRRRSPGEFIGRKRIRKLHKLLLHRLQIKQRLSLHVITRSSVVSRRSVRVLRRNLDRPNTGTHHEKQDCQQQFVHGFILLREVAGPLRRALRENGPRLRTSFMGFRQFPNRGRARYHGALALVLGNHLTGPGFHFQHRPFSRRHPMETKRVSSPATTALIVVALFLITITNASAGSEKVLANFPGAHGGLQPWAGLVSDAVGNFYGVTYYGGPNGKGEVFRVHYSA